MKKIETKLKDCYIIEPDKFGDERGYYSPFFIEEKNAKEGLTMKTIAQGARSKNSKGTVRGLHFQEDPLCQAKLVECLIGGVLDVVVDLRKDSPSYKKWISVELTPENGKQLYVPRGFAHGFVSLKDNTIFQYLVDNDYKVSHENGILWNDPEIGIDWQFEKYGIEKITLNDKDQVRKGISEVNPNFYMHKRYLVTGCKGQLGFDIVRELNKRGIYDILALDVDDMDITDKRIVDKIIGEYKPEYVFHCAAYTAVDKAEENEEIAYKINVDGTRNIANACRNINSKLIYISTDYVFDGKQKENESYKPDDEVNPLSVYGKTKYLGELAALENPKTFVVRTAWVFGLNGNNFVKTMLKLSENHDSLNVVSDQIGSPTYTVDLAKLLVDMSETDKYGIYHGTNSGYTSWAEFADYILKDTDTKVNYVTTEEYYKPQYEKATSEGKTLNIATRPLVSKLDKSKLVENDFNELPDWHEAVDNYKKELQKRKK